MQLTLPFLPLLLATMGAGYLLPNPPGRYNVTLRTGAIIDYDRESRALMLSVFQPVTCTSTVPVLYMPNETAKHEGSWIQKMFNISVDLTSLLAEARLQVCSDDNSSCSSLGNTPILLLSPGYRGSRLYYNIIASAIASEGYTVITIDHPGETNVIVYPDGHVAYSDLPNPTNIDELTQYAYIRAADASFIIDQLSNATAMAQFLPQHGPRQFPTDRIAMTGHSLGGAAAVLAAGLDPRIHSVINWDGPFFGALPSSGISQPVLYVATEREDDPRMLGVWPELNGPKLWIKVAGLLHEGMLDFSSLFQTSGQNTKAFETLLGTISPTQSTGIMSTYTTEWMNGCFVGEMGGSLLQGPDADRFPEVATLKKDNF
ncbi:PAF acetylhydrolase family protein [Aaosphaeria arxii CBS 175.79]|uniref:1-alkyl-2-acetylglycerophosphocholine esterase n=1 Tax=Aaosphaeria arxii CBS 175.79 TaxID=1450172 RepID=A0A6A5XIZ6_9PLEO|nr:PAF acetylhydrolase family protein [Aaosphaeria arxii CBS 175.79]KAF2012807.1 PAF acetylhydrolase family protein [Aaosphaeria arxii CBS 175.79]